MTYCAIDTFNYASFECKDDNLFKIISPGKEKSKIMIGQNKYVKEYTTTFLHSLWKKCDSPNKAYIADIHKDQSIRFFGLFGIFLNNCFLILNIFARD